MLSLGDIPLFPHVNTAYTLYLLLINDNGREMCIVLNLRGFTAKLTGCSPGPAHIGDGFVFVGKGLWLMSMICVGWVTT